MLLAMVMVAAMAGGCGKTETPAEAPVVEAEAEVPEAAEEEPHAPEDQKELFAEGAVLKLTVMEEVTDADNEDAADVTDASEGAADAEDAVTDAEDGEDADAPGAEDGADTEDSTDASFTYGDPVAITAVAAETVEEMEGFELSQTVFGNLNGYTVEDIAETQMYAKSSVNVRSGPSTDYDVLGQLSFAQEVTSNGITSTNWHRIKYNDGEAYMASSYLVMEKPVKQTASAGSSGGTASGGSTDNGSSGAASSNQSDLKALKAEYDAARAAGDTARALELFAQLTGVNVTGGGSNSGGAVASGGDSSSSNSTEVTTSLSQDFVNYLNSQRAAEGLPELAWSDSMASTALERAEEITKDYSHNGVRNCRAEIILATTGEAASHWYDKFYDSSAHRDIMLGNWSSAAAAV